MSNILALNYDEALLFTKQFRDEGEDIVQLYSNTRQRMHLLRDEWSGEAAEVFYEEMESELLPALQRISMALFLCNEVLTKVMKIMLNADEETVGFFGKDLDSGFGLGGFQKSFTGNPLDKDQMAPIPPALKAEEHQPDEKPLAETGSERASGGGGVESDDSRGIKGDLKDMGTGLSDLSPQGDDTKTIIISSNPQVMTIGDVESVVKEIAPQISTVDHDLSSGSVGAGVGITGVIGVAATGESVKKNLKEQNQ